MSLEIIIRKGIAELIPDQGDLMRVVTGFNDSILTSFREHGMREPSRAEIQRRFDICLKWFRDLRGERKWTIGRCLDAIPHALRAELAGGTYEPDKRALWVPQDGAP